MEVRWLFIQKKKLNKNLDMSHVIHGTYISEKINKIRYKPDEFNNSHYFVTGSVDNDQNSIKLWDFHENREEDDSYPYLVSSYGCNGDITEIKVYHFVYTEIFFPLRYFSS